MENAMNRELYTECIRYGTILKDEEFRTKEGGYIRHTTFALDGNEMFFALENGKIINFRLDK